MEKYKNQRDRSQKEDEDLVARIHRHIPLSQDHLSPWLKEAQESFDFYAGHQWSETDQAVLAEQNRPATVFNLCARYINLISGFEVQNRQEGRFFPREPGDVQVNELLTGAANWVRDHCDAEDEESAAFQDALICGQGWIETRVDYETDPDGQIQISQVDPLSMRYDPAARKKNLADARWVAHLKDLTEEELKAHWPEVDLAEVTSVDPMGAGPSPEEPAWADNRYEQTGHIPRPAKPYRVIEYQWFERVPYYRVWDPHNETLVSFSEEQFQALQDHPERLAALGGSPDPLRFVKQYRRRYQKAFVLGNRLLDKTQTPCHDFTFQCLTGLYDRTHNHYYGILRLLKDPQCWANKWLSQIQHILNANAKGGLDVEIGAFANPRQAELDWSRPDSIIYYQPGGLGKVQRRDPPRYPEGVDRLLNYALSAIGEVSGVNAELMGQANRFQAGYLEIERKQSAVMSLAIFFDGLRRYRKQQSRLLADMIRAYLSDGRLIRIHGEQSEQYVPLIKDKLSLQYDVIVDQAPTSTNAKERTFAILTQILPQLLQLGIPVPPDLLEYSPLPNALIQKWKAYMEQNKAGDPRHQERQQIECLQAQLALAAQRIDNQKSEAQAQELTTRSVLNQAKAQKEQAIAQDETAQSLQKMGLTQAVEHAKLKQQDHAMLREQARKDLQTLLDARRKSLESALSKQSGLNPPDHGGYPP